VFTFAVGTFLMVAAAHSFVASFPTFRTYSNILAGFGAVAVFLALEAAQRVGNVWVDRDPQVTGDYFLFLETITSYYTSFLLHVSTTSVFVYYSLSAIRWHSKLFGFSMMTVLQHRLIICLAD